MSRSPGQSVQAGGSRNPPRRDRESPPDSSCRMSPIPPKQNIDIEQISSTRAKFKPRAQLSVQCYLPRYQGNNLLSICQISSTRAKLRPADGIKTENLNMAPSRTYIRNSWFLLHCHVDFRVRLSSRRIGVIPNDSCTRCCPCHNCKSAQYLVR